MPAVSNRQAVFFRAELGRKRRGEKTRTGLSEQTIREFTHVGPHLMSTRKNKKKGRR